MILSPELESQFLHFALEAGVLRFGEFQTKAGRRSPYFFNAGLFHSGARIARLANFYADALLLAESQGALTVDLLYGPAYKGIPLGATTAMALAQKGRDLAFAYNRKEAKDHGEGGVLVGAPMAGRVLILDDVISAGTSVGESVALIRAHGATPAGVLIALDRMERGGHSSLSAVQDVEDRHGLPVIALAGLDGLMALLASSQSTELRQHQAAVAAYRAEWGA